MFETRIMALQAQGKVKSKVGYKTIGASSYGLVSFGVKKLKCAYVRFP
jgi:hypothetical protein